MPHRVLVIRIGRLGDTILATPVIEVLQKALGSDTSIDFATSPGAPAMLLGMDRRIDRVFSVSHRRLPRRLDSGKRALRKISRSNPYDLVINLECGHECDDFAEFVEAREFLGRPMFKPQHVPGRHCVDTEKTVYANALGVELTAAAEPSLNLPKDLEFPSGQMVTDYLVLNPGFSGIRGKGYRSHRRWPDAHWLKLTELISRRSEIKVVLNGSEEERPFLEPLLEMPSIHPIVGCSMAALAGWLRSARCVISVDTGPLHLSMALGIPSIALFGPGNPTLTGPYSKNVRHRVLTSGVDCQPCDKMPHQRQCSFNRCMQELTPEAVYEAFEEMTNA